MEEFPRAEAIIATLASSCQPILLERPTYLQGLGTVPTLWFAIPTRGGSLISWYRCGLMWLQHAEDSLDVEMSYVVDILFQNWGILIRLMHLLQMSEFTAFPDKDNDRPYWKNSLPQTEMLSLSKLEGESLRQGEARADFWRGILTNGEPPSVVLSFSKLRRYWLSAAGLPAFHVISSE